MGCHSCCHEKLINNLILAIAYTFLKHYQIVQEESIAKFSIYMQNNVRLSYCYIDCYIEENAKIQNVINQIWFILIY